jgi:hypothetical protein
MPYIFPCHLNENMDSFTLAMLIFIFIFCLGMHFATLTSQRTQTLQAPVSKRNPNVGSKPTIPIIPHNTVTPGSGSTLKAEQFTLIHPAVLRQNVAVARLMRMEGSR